MAVEVFVVNKGVPEIMDIVKDLRTQGLVQGKDFDFAYTPPEYDFMNGHTNTRHTKFTFYTEKYATLFALKYGS